MRSSHFVSSMGSKVLGREPRRSRHGGCRRRGGLAGNINECSRSFKYVEDFIEKLLGEGIVSPHHLLRVSKDALYRKLSNHASFNFIEMADVIRLRTAIDQTTGGGARDTRGNDRKRSPNGQS